MTTRREVIIGTACVAIVASAGVALAEPECVTPEWQKRAAGNRLRARAALPRITLTYSSHGEFTPYSHELPESYKAGDIVGKRSLDGRWNWIVHDPDAQEVRPADTYYECGSLLHDGRWHTYHWMRKSLWRECGKDEIVVTDGIGVFAGRDEAKSSMIMLLPDSKFVSMRFQGANNVRTKWIWNLSRRGYGGWNSVCGDRDFMEYENTDGAWTLSHLGPNPLEPWEQMP